MRHHIKPIALLYVCLLVAACATTMSNDEAGDNEMASSSDQTQATKMASNGDEIVCKLEEKSGSMLKEEVCLSREAWDKKAREGKKYSREIQRPMGS